MKTIIALVITIFSYCFCYAQAINTPAQWLTFRQNELKECSYIFEGKVIQQSIEGIIYVCSIIEITKIYRGSPQIKLGTIKVTTMQGKGLQDAGPGLSKGSSYIIFGKLTNSKAFDTILVDNSAMLSRYDQISFHDTGAIWGWRQVTRYKTLDSLYSFFKENGLTVQEEEKTDNTK